MVMGLGFERASQTDFWTFRVQSWRYAGQMEPQRWQHFRLFAFERSSHLGSSEGVASYHTQIRAHSSKIYCIDWSRSSRNEIVTCSLDKSIKTWDLQENPESKATILTNYPVWRARNLPFGEGILSLPQRGETTLEVYAKGEQQELIETFEGHSDVVKEFVWREGAICPWSES